MDALLREDFRSVCKETGGTIGGRRGAVLLPLREDPPVREWPGDECVQNGPSRLLGEEGSEKAIPGQGTSKEGRGKEKRVVVFIYGVCLLLVSVVEMGNT